MHSKITSTRLLCALCACLLLSTSVQANNQTDKDSSLAENANVDVLSQIESVLLKPVAIRGQFQQQKQLKILKAPLKSSGDFFVADNIGIIWQVKSPTTSELIISSQGVYFSEQVSNNAERSMRYIGDILNALLAADLTALQKQFTIINSDIDKKKQWYLHLQPKSIIMKKALKRIELKGNTLIHSVKLIENSGDFTLITLSPTEALKVVPETYLQLFNNINKN